MSSRRKEKAAALETDTQDDGTPPGTAVDFIFRTMIARAGAPGKRQIRPKNVDELLQADIQELGSDEDPDFDVSKDKHNNESDLSIGSDSDDEADAEEEEDDDDEDEEEEGKNGTGSGVSNNDEGEDDKRSLDANVEDSDDEDDDDYDGYKKKRVTNSSDDDGTDDGGSSSNDDGSNDDSSGEESSEEETDSQQSPGQKKSALRETLKKLNDAEFAPQQKRKRKRPRKVGTTATVAVKGKGKANAKTKAKKLSAAKSKGVAKKKGEDKAKGKPGKGKDKVKRKKKSSTAEGGHRTIVDMVGTMENSHEKTRKEIRVGNPVCSACLGRSSDEQNEIVECDSCGITVHEGCYGVSDTLTISSGASSASTEPWFCDACRTGAEVLACELCPVQGGLYKETTSGRWVHLVCALYTPGVIITDNGLPHLLDIPYQKWGAYSCSLCVDERFSRSGICIPCDAGMCRTYLHATCAQKYGLLSDPSHQVNTGLELAADPFFAACKLHTNRETSKRRAKCYAILQEQLRIKQAQKQSPLITEEERNNQLRINRKLERIRFKVAIKQAHNLIPGGNDNGHSGNTTTNYAFSTTTPLTVNNLNAFNASDSFSTPTTSTIHPNWKDNKKTRLLPTSAGTAKSFYRKAYLMGLDVKALELEDKHTRIVGGVKRKWNIPPGLSVEFAAYYADRENRVSSLSDQCEKLEKENQQLNHAQTELFNSFDMKSVHNEMIGEDNEKLRDDLVGMTQILKSLCPPDNTKLLTTLKTIESKTENAKQRQRNPSQATRSKMNPPKNIPNKKIKKSTLTRSPSLSSPNERLSIKVCSICNKSEEQPWIIRCDNCKKFYHLKCLDPPLTRIPKRSRQCGWMCSDCGEEEMEVEEAEVDTDAPRTLRGRTKIRKPGKYRNSTDSREGDLKIICDGPETSKNGNPDFSVMVKLERLSKSPGGTILTNGKANKKRKSGSSTLSSNAQNNASLLSPSSSATLLSPTEINGPPVSKRKRKSTPKQKSNEDDKAEKKYVLGKIETEQNNSLDDFGVEKPKPVRRKRKSKITPNTTEAPEFEDLTTGPKSPPKTYPGKKKTSTEQEDGDQIFSEGTIADEGVTVKRKRKRTKKAIIEDVEDENETKYETLSKAKKPRKSLQEIVRKRKEQENAIIGSMLAAAAAAEIMPKKSSDESSVKSVKRISKPRRKSSVEQKLNGDGTDRPEKDKSIPPKKRKRISSAKSTITAMSHQDDVINSVAIGDFDSGLDENKKNGILRASVLSEGVLMQGVAQQNKPGWSNSGSTANSGDEDHSIMKGHAMGTNLSTDEIVTVNASDLIDCVLNPPTTTSSPVSSTSKTIVSSYSPGFYSSSVPTMNLPSISNHTEPMAPTCGSSSSSSSSSASFLTSPPIPSISASKDTNINDYNSKPSSTATGPVQQESHNQNVIKLIYESSDTNKVATPSLSSVPSYAPPVSGQQLGSPFGSPALKPFSTTEPYSKCYTCNKDETKKNMVTCDKCAQDFHFMCLTPPLKYSPRRRNYAWYCSSCDEDKGQSQKQQSSDSSSIQSAKNDDATSSPTLPASSSSPSSTSRFTVHLFADERMKNFMKTFPH